MCGIAGIITTRRDRANDGRPDTPLSRMVSAMVHRGPDDAGCAWHEVGAMQVGLGHRRLSIIDLSSEGHQPMVDPITGATMIFNGELYNYRDLRAELEAGGVTFRGQCDAEVLLHALGRWGAETLERCCGMYALAYLDPTRRRLLLARDHLGIKPLYVAEQGDTLLFASEVRSLLASGLVPRRVDRRAVATYLAYGAVQEPDTIVAGVRSFPPGHAAWIDLDQPVPRIGRPVPHWTMPVPRPMSEAEAIEAYRATFDTAVREHLASDVPLAVLLSAGLDSTVIAAAAARHAADLRTFTIGFDDHADLDESELAAETARLLGTRHTTVPISSDDCRTLVPAWLEDLDQPSVDGLNVYLIAKTIAEHDITVILSGLGADETFGGYPSFTDVPRLARAMRQLRFLPRPVRAGLARTLAAGRPAAVRAKLVDLLTSDGDVVTLCLHRRRTMSNRQMAALGQDAASLDLHPLFVPPPLMDRVERGSDDLAWMIAQIETRFYQGNMLLRDGDANGMAHSLELRVPFLDRRLLDFAFSVPEDVKLPNHRADKHLTRVAFAEHLRPALTARRKSGFRLPIRRWMQGPLAETCERSLQRLRDADGLIAPDGIDQLWRAFEAAPETPIWSRAWSLCVLGSYLERHRLE